MKSLKNLLNLTLLTILLTSCAQEISSAKCGILIEYTDKQQLEAADEMQALMRDGRPILPGMMNDYKKTRNSITKCKGMSNG